jgi:histidinol-phosphatase (PHP family)
MIEPHLVSVHGGHSAQFCNHAKNSLEQIVRKYIDEGYTWVGITEHMPPLSESFVYPEEISAGLNVGSLNTRFADYITTCRQLQLRYAHQIEIFVGFETETYSGSLDYTKQLISRYQPDYIVGSVHHVMDTLFDYSPAFYEQAVDRCGGLDNMYLNYFDQQYEMINVLKPQVVGHFDIIRLYDSNYRSQMVKPKIWEKIKRNLNLVKQLGLILDFNLRPLSREEKEPYLSAPILKEACQLGIDIVPGDDSHGVDDIGMNMHWAIELLENAGLSTAWRYPVDD